MGTKTSILIVDDDLSLRQTLSQILQNQGYVPIGVSTGRAALDTIKEEVPAIALIDLRLEGMSGLEVMKEIKERSPDTECIVLTGHASQASAIEAVNLGAYSYVQKPCDVEQLMVTVRRAVEKRDAKEALRESERFLQSVFDSIQDGISVLDCDLKVIGTNFWIEKMYATQMPLVGKKCHVVYQGLQSPCPWCPSIPTIETGKVHTEIVPYPSGEKPTGWIELSAFPLQDAEGRVVGVIEHAKDITERKRAEEKIRQRTAQLEALRQVVLGLTAQLDLDTLLHSIASQAIELLGGTSGGLYLYRPERDVLEWAVSIGHDLAPTGTVLHRGGGLSGKVWETGEPLIVDDYKQWEGRAGIYEDYPFRAVVGVPVRWGGEFLGVLDVLADPPHTFSAADTELLNLFATQAAIAIRNARLYEEAQARSRYLETLQRINATLRSTLPLSQVLETISRGAGEALNYVGSLILVPDATGERLILGSVWGGRFLDAVLSFTGIELDTFGLPLVAEENPIAQAYLSKELQTLSGAPERIVIGIEPAISPKLAPLIQRAMGAELAACVPLPVSDRVAGVLIVFSPRMQLPDEERAMLIGMADQAGLAIENARLFEQAQQEIAERKRAERKLQQSLEQLRKTFEGTVDVLKSTIEIRDPYTAGHQQQVTQLAHAIASEMGLPEEQIEGIRVAGMIHDIGKISVPAQILSKPGELNSLEYGLIKQHPRIGYDLLKTIDFPWPVAQIVLQHHERMNGSGYPAGLSGDEIMLEARILAVADVVAAMSSHRPYRSTLGLDKALEEISQNRGVLYDAEVVDACLKLFTEKGLELE